MLSHPLVNTLFNLKGNAKACVLTEPMWGIPYNLYAPYISVYMLSFGLKDSQIGLIISIGLFFQIIASALSGVITDKLGRKRTTLISDLISWSIPCIIWAVAQNFNYFLIAAIINSVWRVSANSWTCLLVEDTHPGLLLDVYSWIYISGLLSAFFAPLAGLLVNTYTLVPTMRGLYITAFLLMTAKFFVMNKYVDETNQGKVRLHETKHQNLVDLLKEYREVFGKIIKAQRTLFTLGIMVIMGASQMINSTFWSIIVTRRLNIPEEDIAFYMFARSLVMMLFYFLGMPRIREMHFRNPMLIGFAGFAISQSILILAPAGSYALLLLSIAIEALSVAALGAQVDRMAVITVDAKERARIMAILYLVVILFTSPFGWIAGMLSEINRSYPFMLNLGLFAIGATLTFLAARKKTSEPEPEPVEGLSPSEVS